MTPMTVLRLEMANPTTYLCDAQVYDQVTTSGGKRLVHQHSAWLCPLLAL